MSGLRAKPDAASTRAMLDTICEGVRVGLVGGETRVHVTLAREWSQKDGRASTEFVVVEGFKCAEESCERPFHVRVHGATLQYEYPDHLEHRDV